ncbi:hypothetical protein NC653_022191 [Populus alba x Populus x berolinensis]|uniref:Reverse transcriptase n=1 Tax=Populus alba x Populus x berolinensis TaxID=444605 RepID=A0AAD6QFP9_9ROSI|nr:hypothetical protein NC653_022191 [Populus alba x Populus x berolinensis]
MEIVSTSWDSRITGNPIYQLTTKLCILKSALRKLHQQHTSHIASRVNQAKAAWNEAQFHLDSNPTSTAAKTSERTHASLYMQLCKDEESMLKQRSRINWLQLGDRNTKFFHNSLLHRQVRNRIHGLQDPTGTTITDQQDMGKLASNYYEHLLSAPQIPLPGPVNYMYPNTISEASRSAINLPITDEDIKAALFSIPDNKSPGPDGYNAYFFKHCWSIIGPNFLAAVRYFFTNNCLPRCVNATRIALVPKVENPSCMNFDTKNRICNQLGFQQGTLPVRYLGVPLISTRLKHADCISLLERLTARIKLWTSSSLTYAGRLQLIKWIRILYGQSGSLQSFYEINPSGMFMYLLLHLGLGGKYCKVGNGVGDCSPTALEMAHLHPFGMIIGYRMDKDSLISSLFVL